ncbi:MAG: DoxX family protein [Ilumatobacter sp.]
MILVALAVVSATAFFYYGFTCITSLRVRTEYRRYGIPHLRVLNGTLQLFGAGGVLTGLAFAPLGVLAALGLCVMMLLGLNTRRRLRDPWRARIPASALAVINALLVLLFSLRVW